MPVPPKTGRTTFLASDRPLARFVARPAQQFLDVEAGGGIALLVMTVVALVWANSPLKDSYESLFHTEVLLQVGTFRLSEDFAHWINDALMAVFFFVVGLEIKREWVAGELQDRRAAALPDSALATRLDLIRTHRSHQPPATRAAAIRTQGRVVRPWLTGASGTTVGAAPVVRSRIAVQASGTGPPTTGSVEPASAAIGRRRLGSAPRHGPGPR